MSDTAGAAAELRTRILEEPGMILEDPDVMRALIAANERALGGNVIDLRGVAMERLEERLSRLEDTHRSVIAAAYENLAGTNQVHRAILAFLDPLDFESFLHCLGSDVADILRVGCIRLVLESHDAVQTEGLNAVADVLTVAQPGFIEAYVGRGRPVRQVTLRSVPDGAHSLYGGTWSRSEACIVLDFGEDRLPGMLAMASDDPHQFMSSQGTELLSFLGGVFERAMRRWLG